MRYYRFGRRSGYTGAGASDGYGVQRGDDRYNDVDTSAAAAVSGPGFDETTGMVRGTIYSSEDNYEMRSVIDP